MATTAEYPGFPERIELIGTKGTAVLTAGVVTVHYQDGREERVGEEQGTGGGADPMAFPHDAHRALLADFLDALDQDRAPRVTGREALRVHHFIDAVLRASAERRTVAVETVVNQEVGMTDHPPLKFAAIGLDHRHIYHQVGRLLELGAECKGYYARDSAVPLEGFVRRFPDLPRVRDVRALLEDPEIQLIVTAAIPSERAEIAHRGDAPRQGRHGRQAGRDHARPSSPTSGICSARPGASGRSISPSASRCAR